MACCDWCGRNTRDPKLEPNGRTNLRLCAMCHAEYELREMKTLPVAPLVKPPSFWDRLRGFFS